MPTDRLARLWFPPGNGNPRTVQDKLSDTAHLFDFINNGSIPVFCAGTLDPIVLLPVGARAMAGADRIALVMPTRA